METELRQQVTFLAIMCAVLGFQLAGVVRYWNRLPEDQVGLGLYVASILCALLGIVEIVRRIGGS
jgi:hypothetical protein